MKDVKDNLVDRLGE